MSLKMRKHHRMEGRAQEACFYKYELSHTLAKFLTSTNTKNKYNNFLRLISQINFIVYKLLLYIKLYNKCFQLCGVLKYSTFVEILLLSIARNACNIYRHTQYNPAQSFFP